MSLCLCILTGSHACPRLEVGCTEHGLFYSAGVAERNDCSPVSPGTARVMVVSSGGKKMAGIKEGALLVSSGAYLTPGHSGCGSLREEKPASVASLPSAREGIHPS